MTTKTTFKKEQGFTLIELLVVIGIIGVLAAVVLTAINPLEQLARGRDAGEKTAISQLSRSVEAYQASQGTNAYPASSTTWMNPLKISGDLKALPNNTSVPCVKAGVAQNGYCYESNGTDAIIYARAESLNEFTKAGCTPNSTQVSWVVWSSADGKTGVLCTANATAYPPVGVTGLK
ncbi:MAG: prepilin-type N-terminal cleavage/methylation domain-containing protein [Candidatus Levybacteria bacterium]|nr:prepilin-type N-terminal cleavage/methylation domain-containing protein [Candidatus Levybacteria bacterium]